ncbi:unnamed protein product, partial [Discosporangium mesarthrocarpum]
AACAGLECLTRVILCCGANLLLEGRQAVEYVARQGLELLARAGAGGGGRQMAGVARGREGQSLLVSNARVMEKFLLLTNACLMVPLSDGTRSGCLSLSVTALRACRSHPDVSVATASLVGLAGCDTLLHPRAAPLHLPHAVTHQARAWGSESLAQGLEGVDWMGGEEAGKGDARDDDQQEVEKEGLPANDDKRLGSEKQSHTLNGMKGLLAPMARDPSNQGRVGGTGKLPGLEVAAVSGGEGDSRTGQSDSVGSKEEGAPVARVQALTGPEEGVRIVERAVGSSPLPEGERGVSLTTLKSVENKG